MNANPTYKEMLVQEGHYEFDEVCDWSESGCKETYEKITNQAQYGSGHPYN